MELFQMTVNEVQQLKDQTIKNLISQNRDLKLNYQATKQQVNDSKERMHHIANEGILYDSEQALARLDSGMDQLIKRTIE